MLNISRIISRRSRKDFCGCISTIYSVRSFNKAEDKPKEICLKPKSKANLYIIDQYVKGLGVLENSLEKRYPNVFKVYILFKVGIGEFLADTRTYLRVSRQLWNDVPVSSFNRKELENYKLIPGDLMRVGPVVLIAALPFMNYVIFPIAYFFPRHMLSRHFWTPQQKVEFALLDLRNRLTYYPKILSHLTKHADDIQDLQRQQSFRELLSKTIIETPSTQPVTPLPHPPFTRIKIDSDASITADDITPHVDLFTRSPFHMNHLSPLHMWNLCKCLHVSAGNPSKLLQDLEIMHQLDKALHKETFASLQTVELQLCCFRRGLNAKDLSRQQMIDFLCIWVNISLSIDAESYALLLNLPVLLTYNHQANAKYFLDLGEL